MNKKSEMETQKSDSNLGANGQMIGEEKGSAIVIALLVMILLMGFVALAVSRTSNETIASSNDAAETRTFEAAQASLEIMTHNFDKIFDGKINASTADITRIQGQFPDGFTNDYLFNQEIERTKDDEAVVVTGEQFQGLNALRSEWEIRSTATDRYNGVEVALNRKFFNDKIPLFQFGAFYEDDLELNRPPLFVFGGRVHANGNIFITASPSGIYLNSRVTAAGEIVNDIWKPGTSLGSYDLGGNVFVRDASGVPQELNSGEASVICASPSGVNVFASNPNLPNCSQNPNWSTQKTKFQGNLQDKTPTLDLPLSQINLPLIEMIKRGKSIGDLANIGGSVTAVTTATADSGITTRERFANKAGLRISMADSKNKLPGCAAATGSTTCGVRLDGNLNGSLGYQPRTMADGYQATALNATRMAISGREIWIKVETMTFDPATQTIATRDITEDILSLGVTERAPTSSNFWINGYSSLTDSRSVIKLQRFAIPGPTFTGGDSNSTYFSVNGNQLTFVTRHQCTSVASTQSEFNSQCNNNRDSFSPPFPTSNAASGATQSNEDRFVSSSSSAAPIHLKFASINGQAYTIVPFPIKMFDPREGLANDSESSANSTFGSNNVPAAGAMSMIDIDVANLRRFLMGDFDNNMPTGTPYALTAGDRLRSSAIPESAGWVLHVSDRRGDTDFDGEYDMEDIFPDNVLQFNEDVNGSGFLNTDFWSSTNSDGEAPRYTDSVSRGQAATADHTYYRRGVRLINGTVLPGNYDVATPRDTRGFTVASENGVYILGNYNATGVAIASGTSVTPPENYFPQDTANHIPASIVADAVVVLSNAWTDGNAFKNPFRSSSRNATNTVVRFGMISGDPITGSAAVTYQPSQFGQLNGGIHNFKRFLERWSGDRLNYSGSLINLYNSQTNNSFAKCCTTVYTPPIRDWTFDSTFLDINRLPPGTPFFQVIHLTGFQRVD